VGVAELVDPVVFLLRVRMHDRARLDHVGDDSSTSLDDSNTIPALIEVCRLQLPQT
jgi:hypothetical protein